MHEFRDIEPKAVNPYEPPKAVSSPNAAADAWQPSESIRAWERLRLWYNAALAGEVLLLFLPFAPYLLTMSVVLFAVETAILANVCFCVGPVAEHYLGFSGFRGSWVRRSLFVVGTLFAMLLALIAVIETFVPDK